MKIKQLALLLGMLLTAAGYAIAKDKVSSVSPIPLAQKKDDISGQLKERITKVIDVRNGIAYLPNENEPFTGKYEAYYSSGKIKGEMNFKDGQSNGLATLWYENGQKKSEISFKAGKMNGVLTSWNENGQIIVETNYKDDKKNGLSTFWDKNEQKIGELNYVDGEENSQKLNYNAQKPNDYIEEIKNRCQTQMGEHGAAMVKACVDQDIEAGLALGSYLKNHEAIVTRCITQMGEHGYAMVKACADQDIEAEEALRKY